MIYRLCTFWADVWFTATFIHLKKIDESSFDPKAQQIIVANHISYLDIPVMVKAFRQPMRALGKIEMSKIPVFGFIYRHAIVMVDRKTAAGRAKSLKALRDVLYRHISVFVFPEGTFNETGHPLKPFYDGAFRLAIETKTDIQPVLFLDNFRRLSYKRLLSLRPGICRVVYLKKIPANELIGMSTTEVKQKVYSAMEEKLVSYGADWINYNGK